MGPGLGPGAWVRRGWLLVEEEAEEAEEVVVVVFRLGELRRVADGSVVVANGR